MKNWRRTLRHSIFSGVTAGVASFAALIVRGRRDTGSAIAPINASTHAIWGDDAARVEKMTLRHTLPQSRAETQKRLSMSLRYRAKL